MLREVKSSKDNILGSIIPIYTDNIPDNWLLCNGQDCTNYEIYDKLKISTVPDLRGKFIRGVGGNSAEMGVSQDDCIRNITGKIKGDGYVGQQSSFWDPSNFAGGFQHQLGDIEPFGYSLSNNNSRNFIITFDASRAVPTGPENRPVNIAFNYIIFVGEKKGNSFNSKAKITHFLYKGGELVA